MADCTDRSKISQVVVDANNLKTTGERFMPSKRIEED